VVAILWVDVLEGSVVRWTCISLLLLQAGEAKRMNSTGALGRASDLTMPRPDSSVVERGPEKAGVGGSIPSLATT
jgi:hypothetical protein